MFLKRLFRRNEKAETIPKEEKPKYFLYISESKVKMLYHQLPKKLINNLEAELKVNFHVLEAGVKTDLTKEQTSIELLKIVQKYLEKELVVGTVDQPTDYFRGALKMRTGIFNHSIKNSDEDGDMTWFVGDTQQTFVGLGGSARHLIGNELAKNVHFTSQFGYLSMYLENVYRAQPEPFLQISDPEKRELVQANVLGEGLKILNRNLKDRPKQKMEFLAKTLFISKVARKGRIKKLLIGSPIYVSLANGFGEGVIEDSAEDSVADSE